MEFRPVDLRNLNDEEYCKASAADFKLQTRLKNGSKSLIRVDLTSWAKVRCFFDVVSKESISKHLTHSSKKSYVFGD